VLHTLQIYETFFSVQHLDIRVVLYTFEVLTFCPVEALSLGMFLRRSSRTHWLRIFIHVMACQLSQLTINHFYIGLTHFSSATVHVLLCV